VVNIFKVLSAMDISEKRKPQDGSFGAKLEGREIDFRVATSGSKAGEKLVMRILDNASSVAKIDEVGVRPKMAAEIRQLVTQPHGMFLCCGPTGSGKSTTLYACLREIDRFQKNIITVEDPIEYHIDNITQIEINTKAGQTFATSLRSILRQDPDVIMIGEIRDQETATIACQAATTGHMVFSTVHANDTVTALFRLLGSHGGAGPATRSLPLRNLQGALQAEARVSAKSESSGRQGGRILPSPRGTASRLPGVRRHGISGADRDL
jgi:type II secretory ATPase GspE/PulE/Tfp pilus assembly ATPase PilB-like protein